MDIGLQHLENETPASDCWQCGECCRGLLKGVKVSQQEWEVLEEHMDRLGLNPIIMREANISLRLPAKAERDLNRCVFLKGSNMCEVYEKRPKECKRFPIWMVEGRAMITFVVSSICPRAEALTLHLEKYLPDWAKELLNGRPYRVVLI